MQLRVKCFWVRLAKCNYWWISRMLNDFRQFWKDFIACMDIANISLETSNFSHSLIFHIWKIRLNTSRIRKVMEKKSNKIVMISNDLVLDFIIGIIQIGDTMHHIRRGYFHYSSITTLITNKFQQSRFIGISIVCKCICARLRHNYFFGVSYKTW